MRTTCAVSSAIALTLGITGAVGAVPPSTISYQGLLTDEEGAPLTNASATLSVQIWDDPVDGVRLWADTFEDVALVNGVFDVFLGSQEPLTLPFDAPYYVTLDVDGGGFMTPRHPLTSTPYANMAHDIVPGVAVTSLNGKSDDVTLAGAGGVSISSVGQTITIDASTAGGADADWTVSEETMYAIPPGHVGIGTEAPAAKLHIVEDASVAEIRLDNARDAGSSTTSKLHLGTAFGDGIVDVTSAEEGFKRLLVEGVGVDLDLRTSGRMYSRFSQPWQWILSDQVLATVADGGKHVLQMFNPSSDLQLAMGDNATLDGGFVDLYTDAGARTLSLEGKWNVGSRIALFDPDGDRTCEIVSAGFGGSGASMTLGNGAGGKTIAFNADAFQSSGAITLSNAGGNNRIELHAEHDNQGVNDGGSLVRFFNANNQVTVQIDGHTGATGDGRVITDVLEITGGSDLSERFDIDAATPVVPGMVVSIDPKNPGSLRLSARAYDRRVAGVVSGAGGVRPGMLMGQRGTAADGEHPVALTGRVYAWCDTSGGAIEPGDLLTTSAREGHAMKVSDRERAPGAVLGKAMSSLETGRGLVLVLVNLQ